MTNYERVRDFLFGPIADRLGSSAVERKTEGGVTIFDLVDKSTGEIVGWRMDGVRDGFFSVSSFSRPTILRKKLRSDWKGGERT